ncbi:glycoside hydrolase family 31 protein [Mucilaginibacter ginsenosidivorax]|uniref:Glycoside hydrolase family 31 protein n=1 Tax=Mucilaginibacter ginsenosidivorax TaxID=862126 RepID=A0A5B8W6M0_9SPHI|nr:TIM-barrel domain-containing protein [Mucilaginibacter ginsenosidivorax]QEC78562.1 glycoside hydrolase family 31 protein [Mucilaginibacter ginsenosidivorax]
MNFLRYLLTGLLLLTSTSLVYSQNIKWLEVEPGIWKGIIGKPENFDLLKASGAVAVHQGLSDMGQAKFPLGESDITAKVTDGKTYLHFPLSQNEQLYGLGLNFKTVQQRGRILTLHVDNYEGKDNGRTHSPTPFYISSNGYGVFINSARYIQVYAGTAVRTDSKNPPIAQDRNTDDNWSARPYSDGVDILVPAQGVEVYVLGGPTMLDAVRRYNLLSGGGCLPPRWGLGFTQRVQRLSTAADVLKEADAFEEKGYPLDFIGLEPGWQSKSYPCTFEWDKSRFPDPRGFVGAMLKKNVRLNLWTNPYISPESPIAKIIAGYTGSHSVWVGAVADITIPEARQVFFGELSKNKIDIGVSGFKIDEVDGGDEYLWPDVATFPSGHSAEQMRQTYGLMMQRYVTGQYHQLNRRTFGLVRASNGGGSSFPFVIYNDYYNHRDFITALINSGFAGVLWTPEVRDSKTAEEWLRRFQSNIFSPMAMINAWESGTKPWTFPEVAAQVKQMAALRMQMMPYWYSEFAKYHFKGIPPFRSMVLEDGFGNHDLIKNTNDVNLKDYPYGRVITQEVKDQYMAGQYLLVAPMFNGETSRKVILPKGNWYDFYTGKYAGNGEVISVMPGLDKIPVYVKDGGIIPMMPATLHAPKANEKVDLEIRYYGNKPGYYLLYDDDGETFEYEKGAWSFRKIKVELKKGKIAGEISAPVKGKPNTIGKVTFKKMG